MTREKSSNEVGIFESLDGLNPGALDERLPYHSYQMQKALTKYADKDLDEISLGRTAFRPILLIRANPGVVQGKLASAMSLERSSIVPVIDRLEEEGYVERRPHPKDKRSKALWLTRKGTRIAVRIEKIISERELKIFTGFSQEEQQMLLSLMRRAVANIWGLSKET